MIKNIENENKIINGGINKVGKINLSPPFQKNDRKIKMHEGVNLPLTNDVVRG